MSEEKDIREQTNTSKSIIQHVGPYRIGMTAAPLVQHHDTTYAGHTFVIQDAAPIMVYTWVVYHP